MTVTWRVTAAPPGRTAQDLFLETSSDATAGGLRDAMQQLGLGAAELTIDGRRVSPDEELGASGLRHGAKVFGTDPRSGRRPGWYIVSVAGPDTGRFVELGEGVTSVGRDDGNSLVLRDADLSPRHFLVRRSGEELAIEDAGSADGTRLEGHMVEEAEAVAEGAFVSAGATTFGFVHVLDESLHQVERSQSGPSDIFHIRYRDSLEPLVKKLEHPEDPRNRPTGGHTGSLRLWIMSGLTIGIMALLLGLLVWNVASSMGQGNSFLASMWNAVSQPIKGIFTDFDVRSIFLLLMPLMLLTTGFDSMSQLRKRRKDKREFAESVEKYEQDRARLLERLDKLRSEERICNRLSAVPSGAAALFALVQHARVWERSKDHHADYDDFCEITMGLHDRPSEIAVERAPDGAEFPFDKQPSLALRHSLVNGGSLAVVGDKNRGRGLARALLLELASSHSPDEVKLWLITDAEDHSSRPAWNGMRWLPHNMLGSSVNAAFATADARGAALKDLRQIIDDRVAHSARKADYSPTYVVVVDCPDQIESELLTYILEKGDAVGVLGIVISTTAPHQGTRAELKLGGIANGAAFSSDSQPRTESIQIPAMNPDVFESASRSLASLQPASKGSELQSDSGLIRLASLLGVATDADGDGADPKLVGQILQEWSRGPRTRVKVGGLSDWVAEIDIVDDGPHGLVGGATRSGKTEFLRSFFTALAVANHPDDFSIVIIDFKGGVDHELSASLPHVVELCTNDDIDLFVRNIRLIEAEKERRERAFRAADVNNIDAYRAKRAVDESLPAIPRLLVVVDEFSVMLSNETGNDNLKSLVQVTNAGAGLGMHLLLVTQNFQNKLPDDIAANAGLRICFRVQEAGHSKAVLGSDESASISKGEIGRAYLRIKGEPAVEFQSARVAGPRPGKEAAAAPVKVRPAPFEMLSLAPPPERIVDVPTQDTDMYAIVQAIARAADDSGWKRSAIPWPPELQRNLGISARAGGDMVWPVGLLDESENQLQRAIGLAEYGPHTLFVGDASARLGEVLRAVVVSGAIRRSPEELHFYIIDNLGSGMTSLAALPHVGAFAERHELLGLRIVRHLVGEVTRRKARMSEMGAANIRELQSAGDEHYPDVVLLVHGAEHLIGNVDAASNSLLLTPILSLLADAVGTGIRILMSGSPRLAQTRLGASVQHRFIHECAEASDYAPLGVAHDLRGEIKGLGRAVDLASNHLVQFALVPSTAETSVAEVVQAIAWRLAQRWGDGDDPARLPVEIRELPWPLPLRSAAVTPLPAGVELPVSLCVHPETGAPKWLDAAEDGPVFVVSGPSKSGRSNALIVGATLMSARGWRVLGLPLSRRSPVSTEAFPGTIVTAEDLGQYADADERVALFIDDAHRWTADVERLQHLLDGPGPRAVIAAGPTEYFNSQKRFDESKLHHLPSKFAPFRSGLLLAPRRKTDASCFGVVSIPDELMRDNRPGMGVVVVAGELSKAQVPLASTDLLQPTA